MLIVSIKGKSEIGPEMLKKGYNVFINNPINIIKAMLNPAEYKIISIIPSLCNRSSLNMSIPGINVRYINPISCLKIGILKPMNSKPIK
jgi:hypothetical protein